LQVVAAQDQEHAEDHGQEADPDLDQRTQRGELLEAGRELLPAGGRRSPPALPSRWRTRP
jgi:hypothetical protein